MRLSVLQHRALLRELVVQDLTRRSAGSGFGRAWLVLQPLLTILLFSVVFSRIMTVRLGPEATPADYVVYLCAGLLPWLGFQDALHRAGHLFLENAALVKRIAFPPMLLVLQLVGASLVVAGGSFAVLLVVLALTGRLPGLEVLWALPALLFLGLLLAGLAMALAVLAVFFRDLNAALPFVTGLWFWLTPIVYTPAVLPPGLVPWLRLNPVVPILGLFRHAAGAPGGAISMAAVATAGGLALLVAAAGYALFRRLVRDVPDQI